MHDSTAKEPDMEITSTSTAVPTTADTSRDAFAELDGEAFLKLLVVQLQNQDPLNPMDNQQFITQMAQLTSLEELQSLNNTASSASATGQLGLAASLIGRNVEWTDATGNLQRGTVQEAAHSATGTDLLINDTRVALSTVVRVTGNVPVAE